MKIKLAFAALVLASLLASTAQIQEWFSGLAIPVG
jgi:hypothetical protein